MAKVNAMLDPRGYQERPMLQLAKRPSLAELKKGKILFYNNTKLASLDKGTQPFVVCDG